jgi:CBS domain-containing protein
MATDVLVMEAAWTVREAAKRLRAAHVAGGPVVADGRLVGVVTMRDLLRWTRSETVEVYAPVEYVEQRQSWLPGLVGEAATEEVVCARPDWSLQRAVAAMRMAGVRRLPVVDDDGRLVGVVGYEVVEGIARYLRRRHAGVAAAQAPAAPEP